MENKLKIRYIWGFKYVARRTKSTSWMEEGIKHQTHKSSYKETIRILVIRDSICVNFISFNKITGTIIANYKY